MNIRPYRKDDVTLEITPLIDIVFLLLIFFMVSTEFERDSEINITLPQASEEPAQAKPDAINVGVDVEGKVYINDKPLLNDQLTTIKNALSLAIVGLDEPPIIISADSQATHQSVIRVMDAARQLGLVKIVFAIRRFDEE